MSNKKSIFYLIGFFVCQLILVLAIFFVQKNMDLFIIFCLISFVIFITFLGDYCIFGIILSVNHFNESQAELQRMIELNEKNYQFYQFAVMQQKNIRHFYHDLSNHLMTLEILKNNGDYNELRRYSETILNHYHQLIPNYKTGNVMLDILSQYYLLTSEITVIVKGKVPYSLDFTKILKIIQGLEEFIKEQSIFLNLDDCIFTLPIINNSLFLDKLNELSIQYPEYRFTVGEKAND